MLASLSTRQRNILAFLLTRENPTPASQLATRYGASLRTVRYDLDAIRIALKGTGVRLASRPHRGVWIEGPGESRNAVAGLLTGGGEPLVLSPQAREDRLVLELLAHDQGLSLQEVCEMLSCSRTTILRHLPGVERRLKGMGLRLQRVRGRLCALGTERGRRQALVQALFETISPNHLIGLLRGSRPSNQGLRPGPDGLNVPVGPGSDRLNAPAALVPDGGWIALARIVDEAEASLGRKFTDESFAALVIHLAVGLQRLRYGHSLAMPASQLAELRRRPEWQVAEAMAHKIAARTGITLPEGDLGYLVFHLVGGRSQALTDATDPPKGPELDDRTEALVERFIRLCGDALGLDLSGDRLLHDGLAWHLQGLLTRQRFRLPATNPLKSEIRQQMEPVYRVVSRVVAELRADLGTAVTDDEIGFLTMHVAAALERGGYGPGPRVLVVCSSGLGSAHLLAARLRRVFKELTIVGVVSALESTESSRQHQVDLVVSTVPLPALPVPQVQVSPLLDSDEIERVRRALRRPDAVPHPAGIDGSVLLDYLLKLIAAHATIQDPEGLRRDLDGFLLTERPPLELIEPVVREVGLLGIQPDPAALVGMAIHLKLALPRFRAGDFITEPQLERMRREYVALFRAVERGLQLIARWHGLNIPPDEVVPIMRYILPSTKE